MVAHINAFAFNGIDVVDVDVQVHLSSGLPTFMIVGLADKAVAESKERVRAALNAIGLSLPPSRVIVNLAPADLQKEGSHFDLPIALGLLVSMNVITNEDLTGYIVLGELSLDGELMPIAGVLPAAIGASARRKGLICPKINGQEAAWAGDISILAPQNILELINHLKGTNVLPTPPVILNEVEEKYPDIADIKGQESAKRALEIAAAGNHNMLMIGPPGSGKSMLATRLPGLIPPLNSTEMLEISMIDSISGKLINRSLTKRRPFRDPHHNCSMPAMVGGGSKAKPGEVTLSHKGILFLDELPEFSRQVLDSLRQPLEARKVTISRVQSHITYPADFQLIAAMNPCRCGYLSDASRACNKAPLCAADYQDKLSGPLLDRIDLHVEVPAVSPIDVYRKSEPESSTIVKARIFKARNIQKKRYSDLGITVNAALDGKALLEYAPVDTEGQKLLEIGVERMGLSMRGHNRVLKVARTIADLEDSKNIKKHHIAESLTYRQLMYKRR